MRRRAVETEVTGGTAEFRGLRSRHAGVSPRARRPPRGHRSCPPTPRWPPDGRRVCRGRATAGPAKAGAGSAPSGATAITPRRSRCRARRDVVGQAPRRSRRRPHRGPGRAVEVDLHQHAEPAAGPVGRAVEGSDQLAPVDRLDHVGVADHRARLVGLQLADEVDPQPVAVARLGQLRARPPGRGSPRRRVTPSSASRSTSEAGKNFVTATSVSSAGSRPACAHAASMRDAHGREAAGELVPPGRTAGGHDRPPAVTTPAYRPVVPSRR